MSSDNILTIYVLAGGEYFAQVMNAVAAFLKQNGFFALLRLSALVGIVMASIGFIKSRDPMIYGRWFLAYVFFINLILIPKTTVMIQDISTQQPRIVANVPVVMALGASLMTSTGYGLAQAYDMLFSRADTIPDAMQYTKTGSLFGSKLISAARSFRIIDPVLKEEMNQYFRSCVVGDIRLNQKYSLEQLAHAPKIWELISTNASPLRMTKVNGKMVTCQEAAKKDSANSLVKKLEAEIKSAYTFFGVNLFGKPHQTTYEALFTTHLKSAFDYYQNLSDSASDIFLQSMMINAMNDGVAGYQVFTDSTAGIINQQMSKSQVQHRWSWAVMGKKAAWMLPMMHTWLTILMFGVFPLVLILASLPSGMRVVSKYVQFFLSLQFWPVFFAIFNFGAVMYGKSSSGEYGHFTMVNLDQIDELHADIAGMAGYLMMLIPFLAHGLGSNLGAAFNNLATGMMSHMQGSSMGVAGEAASGSFALGQTSFYNTNANNFSANKHDANWTHMAGMRTGQMSSGVLKTSTASGQTVFDVSPGMSKGAIHIADSDSMVGSLNEAYDSSKQAASNASQHMQSSLSNFAHHAVQLSKQAGQDVRMGEGISMGESAQASKAASTVTQIAEDVAKRHGISTEDALAHMTNLGWGMQGSIKSDKSAVGKLAQYISGASASVEGHSRFNRTSTGTARENTAYDDGESTRKAQDFTNSMNFIKNYATSKHADDSHSNSASLMNQMGADLRETQTASQNHDASLSRAERISQARSFVQSESAQITTDLNQAFPAYVASRVGEAGRDQLYSHPGDMQALQKLQSLGHDFVAEKREGLIARFGTHGKAGAVDAFYQQEAGQIKTQETEINSGYARDSQGVTQQTKDLKLGVDEVAQQHLKQATSAGLEKQDVKFSNKKAHVLQKTDDINAKVQEKAPDIQYQATNGIIPYHTVDNTLETMHLKKPREKN